MVELIHGGLILGILQYASGATFVTAGNHRAARVRSNCLGLNQRHEINKFTVLTKQEIVRFQYFSDAAPIGQFTAYIANIVVYGQVGKSCKIVTAAQTLNFK